MLTFYTFIFKFGAVKYMDVYMLGVERRFLKLTFMWWKSSQSRLVTDDVINEQISLELWQTPCAQLWYMTQRCPHDYCTYNSLFLSVLSSLGRYISQIPACSKSDTDK